VRSRPSTSTWKPPTAWIRSISSQAYCRDEGLTVAVTDA
jgi:hypothetical protein